MKVVAIFAHPDDEAFGPAGTLALLSQTHDVYLLCVTNGEAGRNSINSNDALVDIRCEELKKSAKILGIKEVLCLDFKDGTLNNNQYHIIFEAINKYIEKVKPEILLTFDLRGFLGHIDHYTVSAVTSYIFQKQIRIKKLMYYCMSEEQKKIHEPYFIFIPDGYKKDEIMEIYDVSHVWEKKVASMKAHASQIHDYERIAQHLDEIPKEEYFIVKMR